MYVWSIKNLKPCPLIKQEKKTYRQVFQLQLTDCVVRFDVVWDKGELEIGIIKDNISLLSVRPILGTFNLKQRYTLLHNRKRKAVRLLTLSHIPKLHLQILSLWPGSASRHRGSSAPIPSPRSCHMCLEGVPEKIRIEDFILSITK